MWGEGVEMLMSYPFLISADNWTSHSNASAFDPFDSQRLTENQNKPHSPSPSPKLVISSRTPNSNTRVFWAVTWQCRKGEIYPYCFSACTQLRQINCFLYVSMVGIISRCVQLLKCKIGWEQGWREKCFECKFDIEQGEFWHLRGFVCKSGFNQPRYSNSNSNVHLMSSFFSIRVNITIFCHTHTSVSYSTNKTISAIRFCD